jgi:hypothetical protein
MIIQNKKLRLFADYIGIAFTLLAIRKIKKHGNKQAMLNQLNNWKPVERTKTIPFKIAKWYANK